MSSSSSHSKGEDVEEKKHDESGIALNNSHDADPGTSNTLDTEKNGPSTTTNDPEPSADAAAAAAEGEAQPDGGSRAWLQVVGSFLVFSNLWGPTFAFGSFQSYYHLHYIPNESPSDIAWIGTFASFLLIFGGVISGPLFDRGYFRTMLLVGALVETLGMFLLSLCKTYWQIWLTQAVLMGLGNGLLYIPGLTLVGRSFRKRRSIAMSITTCGAPVGGIVYTLMFEQLIDRIGFAQTVRAMGYFMLGTYCISFPLSLWKVKNLKSLGSKAEKGRKLFDVTALRDLPFCLFSFAQFFIFLVGCLIPVSHFLHLKGSTLGGKRENLKTDILSIPGLHHPLRLPPNLRPSPTRPLPNLQPNRKHHRPSLLNRGPNGSRLHSNAGGSDAPLDNLRPGLRNLLPLVDRRHRERRIHRHRGALRRLQWSADSAAAEHLPDGLSGSETFGDETGDDAGVFGFCDVDRGAGRWGFDWGCERGEISGIAVV